MSRSIYNYNGYNRERSRSPPRNETRDRDNRLIRDYTPNPGPWVIEPSPPRDGPNRLSEQRGSSMNTDPRNSGWNPEHIARALETAQKARPVMPQLKPYPPDRYAFHCQTCRIEKELYICCYQQQPSIGYMLPVLYCSISCQQHDFNNAQRPHRAVCNSTLPQQSEDIKHRLVGEQDRNDRITKENNSLNSRIKQYQEDILHRENEIVRLREARKKTESELQSQKANTKSALKEAKQNEIRKDSIDRMVSQMKKRIEDNERQEKEILERKKTIDNLKKFIQNEMELYQSHKIQSEKKITELENELKLYKEKHKEDPLD